MDMEVDVIIHSEKAKLLSTETLMKSNPEFDWTGGHSGRLLDENSAKKLEELWKEFLVENKDIFNNPNNAWLDELSVEL